MSLNPPLMLLAPGMPAVPMGIVGEAFLLRREGVELTVKEAGLKGVRCTLYLTTLRLCFVLAAPTPALAALDVPLQGLRGDPDFVQPFFGANYLAAAVAPVPGRGLVGEAAGAGPAAPPGAVPFRATFSHGGAATFLHFFFRLLEQYRVADERARAAYFAALAAPPAAAAFVGEQTAFFDPSDPSVVFLTQPAWTTAENAPRAPPASIGYGAPAPAPPAQVVPVPAPAPAPAQSSGGTTGIMGTIGRSLR